MTHQNGAVPHNVAADMLCMGVGYGYNDEEEVDTLDEVGETESLMMNSPPKCNLPASWCSIPWSRSDSEDGSECANSSDNQVKYVP